MGRGHRGAWTRFLELLRTLSPVTEGEQDRDGGVSRATSSASSRTSSGRDTPPAPKRRA